MVEKEVCWAGAKAAAEPARARQAREVFILVRIKGGKDGQKAAAGAQREARGEGSGYRHLRCRFFRVVSPIFAKIALQPAQ